MNKLAYIFIIPVVENEENDRRQNYSEADSEDVIDKEKVQITPSHILSHSLTPRAHAHSHHTLTPTLTHTHHLLYPVNVLHSFCQDKILAEQLYHHLLGYAFRKYLTKLPDPVLEKIS